jgi:hypothetical protein
MSDDTPDIVIIDRPIDPGVLRQLVERHFEDMVIGDPAVSALLLLRPAAARQIPLLLG